MNKGDLKNGMTLVLRNGCKVDYYKGYMMDFYSEVIMKMDNYNDDLTYNDRKCDFWDICEIIENGLVIWKREEIDWSKVPIGTKILFSINGREYTEGLFIKKDGNKFIVCDDIKNRLFTSCNYCELAEELNEEVPYNDVLKEFEEFCNGYFKIDRGCAGCKCNGGNGTCNKDDFINNKFTITRK